MNKWMPEWRNQMVLPSRQNILKMNPSVERARYLSIREVPLNLKLRHRSVRIGRVRLAPVTFQNSIKKKLKKSLFHLRFKNGWLTVLVIYWLLVSVVHQSFLGVGRCFCHVLLCGRFFGVCRCNTITKCWDIRDGRGLLKLKFRDDLLGKYSVYKTRFGSWDADHSH